MDPSIRAEVWEFLLGCYAVGSTTKLCRQLRAARRLSSLHFLMYFQIIFFFCLIC